MPRSPLLVKNRNLCRPLNLTPERGQMGQKMCVHAFVIVLVVLRVPIFIEIEWVRVRKRYFLSDVTWNDPYDYVEILFGHLLYLINLS